MRWSRKRLIKALAALSDGILPIDSDNRVELFNDRYVEIFSQACGQTITGNFTKIADHGRRADNIVRNMLLHSREGLSELQCVALNSIAEEALNLAYHSARAESRGFQCRDDHSHRSGRRGSRLLSAGLDASIPESHYKRHLLRR